MELSKAEVSVVEAAIANTELTIEQELTQLQLAMVGGGIGETVL